MIFSAIFSESQLELFKDKIRWDGMGHSKFQCGGSGMFIPDPGS
jgi:hypothetical protein